LFRSDAALSGHYLVGGINGSNFPGRDRHEFGWNASRYHRVRMVLEYQLAVVAFQRVVINLERYSQHLIRITFSSVRESTKSFLVAMTEGSLIRRDAAVIGGGLPKVRLRLSLR
jgi:hypothetical protein